MEEIFSDFDINKNVPPRIFRITSILLLVFTVVSILQYYYTHSSGNFTQSSGKSYNIFFILIFQVLPLCMSVLFMFKFRTAWYFLTCWSITFVVVLTKYFIGAVFINRFFTNISSILFNPGIYYLLAYLLLAILLLQKSILRYLNIKRKQLLITVVITVLLNLFIVLSTI